MDGWKGKEGEKTPERENRVYGKKRGAAGERGQERMKGSWNHGRRQELCIRSTTKEGRMT